MRILTQLLLGGLLFFLVAAAAEEKFGVPVFAGATFDQQNSEAAAKNSKRPTACYITKATVAQVNAFYKKQSGVVVLNDSTHSGLFIFGSVNVSTQSPWPDAKDKQVRNDTLITLIKTE